MIGTLDHERILSTTSAPSMSGRPRSTMTRSIGRSVAERIASAPVPASWTTNSFSSNPVRRNRRILISSSTTRTMGAGSLIGTTFQLRQGSLRHRQGNGNGIRSSRPFAGAADLAVIGADESARDPETEAGAARGRGMPLATREAIPDLGCFGGGQSRAFVGDVDIQAAVLGSHCDFYLRAGLRVLHGIVENLHQRLLNQNRIDVNQR